MRTLFKTLVLPHVDYCSQLWAPSRASDLLRLEKIQKNFLRKIPSLSHLSYWDQLESLKMYSIQRRLERYRVIYIWKLIEGIVPDCGVRESHNQETRLGRRVAATNGPGRTTLTGQTIPLICHRHHRRCLCKKFLSGVNFSRMSEKMHIYDFFRDIFSVFGDFSRFFGCKIWFSKILSV